MNRIAAALAGAALVTFATTACSGPQGMGMGGMRMGPDNTAGWAMMTPQEREEHHKKMMGAKTPAECKAHMEAHHGMMAERAKARGMAMDMPAHDMCGMMQQHGMLK
jgi:hypothetical protein